MCVPIQFIKNTSGFWCLALIMSISCLYIFCIYVYILSIYILSICLHKQSICIYTCFMSISCIYTFCLYVYKNCLYVYIHHFSNFICPFFFLCTDFGHFLPKRHARFWTVFGPRKNNFTFSEILTEVKSYTCFTHFLFVYTCFTHFLFCNTCFTHFLLSYTCFTHFL